MLHNNNYNNDIILSPQKETCPSKWQSNSQSMKIQKLKLRERGVWIPREYQWKLVVSVWSRKGRKSTLAKSLETSKKISAKVCPPRNCSYPKEGFIIPTSIYCVKPTVSVTSHPHVSIASHPHVSIASYPHVSITSHLNMSITSYPHLSIMSYPQVSIASYRGIHKRR